MKSKFSLTLHSASGYQFIYDIHFHRNFCQTFSKHKRLKYSEYRRECNLLFNTEDLKPFSINKITSKNDATSKI